MNGKRSVRRDVVELEYIEKKNRKFSLINEI
jgi:hypothetical protein